MARRRPPDPSDPLLLGTSPPPTWSAALLVRLLRRPAVYWSAVGVLALLSLVVIHRFTADARALRSAYGATTEVLVTTGPVEAGDRLAERSSVRQVPVGLVPDGALDSIGPEERSAATLTAGSVVTAAAVAPAAALGPDDAALAIPRGPTTPPAGPGQAVLVVVNADPLAGLEHRLVEARVVEADDERLVVAIGRGDLAVTSAALQAGDVVVALGG